METKQMPAIARNLRHVGTGFQYSVIVLALMNIAPSCAVANDDHSHTAATEKKEVIADQHRRASALLRTVRESTERLKEVAVAESEGYALQFGCVTGDYSAAMGLHYVNGALVSSGVLDVTRPQIR